MATDKAATRDPASIKMQILATEHWSLLASRSLTYSESLSRVTMFLSVLSGAVIALALVAQADRFGGHSSWWRSSSCRGLVRGHRDGRALDTSIRTTCAGSAE